MLRLGAYQILGMDAVPALRGRLGVGRAQVKGTRSRAAAGLVNAVLRQGRPGAAFRESIVSVPRDRSGGLSDHVGIPPRLAGSALDQVVRARMAARALVDRQQPRALEVFLRPVGGEALNAPKRCWREARVVRSGRSGGEHCQRPRADAPGSACGTVSDPGAALAAVPARDSGSRGLAGRRTTPVAPAPGSLGGRSLFGAGGQVAGPQLDRAGGVLWPRIVSPLRRVARVVEGAPPARRPRLGGSRGRPLSSAPRGADVVLVDAPCSGTGTLRRHPDGRWRVREADIHLLAGVQRSILDGAASVVPRDGLLVYATCALEPEENWGQVESFLARHPDFRVEAGAAPERWLDPNGCLMVMPGGSGFDGAFAARLRRVSC